jgi:class 3 adenylate cyclase/DNA-binding NarL/FixJ family response regulator
VSTVALPTGTVTFLFTDIDGSTQLVKRLGEGYGQALTDHQRLLRSAFAQAAGREIDTQGDSFFVVFGRAKDAISAALAATRQLAAHEWPDGAQVRVRMGMHTGEPAVAAERYIGLGVHRGARICAAGHGGQMLLSNATYTVLVDELLPDIGFLDLGEHRLKDLDRPERIYQLVVPDLQREFPPLRTVGTASPKAIAVPFSGREHELAEIVLSSAPKDRLSLVIADDSVLVREGVGRLLEDAGFDILGRAGDAEELVSQVSSTRPAVVITDIKMPPTHTDEGLVAAERIRSLHPEIGVLVLSQYLDSRYAMRLLEHYPERVGYLLKDRVSDLAVLSDAVRRIAEGECVLDPTIVSQLMKGARREGPLSELSEHERELLALTAEGRSNRAIADELGQKEDTVGAELDAVFARIGLGTTPDELRRIVPVLDFLRTS